MKKSIIEYKGTKAEERYSSKSAMKKHEKGEGKKQELKEKLMAAMGKAKSMKKKY